MATRLSYSELSKLNGYEDRMRYLISNGPAADDDDPNLRKLKQGTYRSKEWRQFRSRIIARDMGCDAGCNGHEIQGSITVHHINPLKREDYISMSNSIMDEDNVICLSFLSHEAVTTGNIDVLKKREPIIRLPNDTCLWRNN